MSIQTKSEILGQLHYARSQCIDAFAEVEEAVVALLDLLLCKSSGELFGQKIELLKAAKPSPKFSKQRLTNLQSLLPECSAASLIRNDIVHSRLQLAELDGQYRACFVNAKQCLSGGQSARLFSLEGLHQLHDRLRALSTELKQVLINPASMPKPLRLASAAPEQAKALPIRSAVTICGHQG